MAKKTYKTYHLKGLQVLLFDEWGRPIVVNFKSGVQIDSTAKFSTNDEKVQKALEKSSGFNRDYYLESTREEGAPVVEATVVEETPKEEEKPLTDVKDIKRFKNLVEMRNYMAEIGIEGAQDMNYSQAKAAAKKEGYDFQIQK